MSEMPFAPGGRNRLNDRGTMPDVAGKTNKLCAGDEPNGMIRKSEVDFRMRAWIGRM